MIKAAVWVAGLVLLLGGPGTAAVAAPTACPGVLVVVQYRNEAPVSRCADRFATGREALVSAGFRVTDQDAMICRIDARPEACRISAAAYWSYWHAVAAPGGGWSAWSYSTLGAGSYHPAAGDAEGWVFSDGSAPPAYPLVAGSPASSASASAVPATSRPAAPAASADAGPVPTLVVLGVVLAVGLVTGIVVIRRRG